MKGRGKQERRGKNLDRVDGEADALVLGKGDCGTVLLTLPFTKKQKNTC